MSYSYLGALPASPASQLAARALASSAPASRVRSSRVSGRASGRLSAATGKQQVSQAADAQKRLQAEIEETMRGIQVVLEQLTRDKDALEAAGTAAEQATRAVRSAESAERSAKTQLDSAELELRNYPSTGDGRRKQQLQAAVDRRAALHRQAQNRLTQAQDSARRAASVLRNKTIAHAKNVAKLQSLRRLLARLIAALSNVKTETRKVVVAIQALPVSVTSSTTAPDAATAAAQAEAAAATAAIADATQTEQQAAAVLDQTQAATSAAQDALADAKTQVTEVAQAVASTPEEAAALVKDVEAAKTEVAQVVDAAKAEVAQVTGFKLSLPMVAAGAALLLLLRR